MFLQELHGHENIIEVLNLIEADNNMDIYIVCDFMESDLHAVIKAGILEDVHKQYILYQLLKALKYMHSGQLIHRDLKPSNVLLNSDCHVKLCDFGLARSVAPTSSSKFDAHPVMTDYVATRWYRAPELLVGSTAYTKGVDIWAVGCILAEMIVGKPVFPGTSTLDQLERVIEITGRPSQEDVESVKSPFANQMLDSVQPHRRMSLEDLMPKASVQALDFLKRCFQFNPAKRASASELLAHPYLSQFHDAAKEMDCSRTIDIPLDDNVRLTIKDYREKLYEEISKRRAMNKEEQSSTPSTPPKMNVPSTQGVSKQYSYRASNLTPTTCHTNTGHSTPTTPGTSKSKLMRSPSVATVAPVPYRTTMTVAGPKSPKVAPGAKPRIGSVSRSASVSASQGARAVLARPPSAARMVRTPSTSSLLARVRAASPAAGKRPTTSYYR